MADFAERNQEIIRLYSQGETKSAIARRFNISKPRVSDIIKRYERSKIREKELGSLTTRAANAIMNAGLSLDDTKAIAKRGWDFVSQPNCGQHTANNIRDWLKENHGLDMEGPTPWRPSCYLEQLSLTPRTKGMLRKGGVTSKEQIMALTHDRVTAIYGAGGKIADEILRERHRPVWDEDGNPIG